LVPSAPELEIRGLRVAYGPVIAVDGVDLVVPRGSVVALIGANGAGKSSLIRAIVGAAPAKAGLVLHRGDQLPAGRRPYQAARRGIAHVPEGRRIISPLTVEENLLLATGRKSGPAVVDMVYELFPRLRERRKVLAGVLSGGEQQMLAIGRALAAEPTCVLLDEPSMGLAPIVIEEVYSVFADRLRGHGTTFLLAEQSAAFALRVADTVGVLAGGRLVHVGTPAELAQIDDLAEVYFGGTKSSVKEKLQ
jgi:branched-chain amino acid transport system ATP-binding protein